MESSSDLMIKVPYLPTRPIESWMRANDSYYPHVSNVSISPTKPNLRAPDSRKRLALSSDYLANKAAFESLDACVQTLARSNVIHLTNKAELRALDARKRLSNLLSRVESVDIDAWRDEKFDEVQISGANGEEESILVVGIELLNITASFDQELNDCTLIGEDEKRRKWTAHFVSLREAFISSDKTDRIHLI